MESLALSPNGNLIAWVANSGTQPVLQVLDLANGKQVKAVNVPGGLDVRDLDWADDQVLLIHNVVEQETEGSPFRTVAMDVATGKSCALSHTVDLDYEADARLLAPRLSKPHAVITSSRGFPPNASYMDESRFKVGAPGPGDDNHRWGLHLFEIDARTCLARVIEWGKTTTESWVVDDDGRPLARSDFKKRWKLFTVQYRRGSDWVEIFRLESGEKPQLLGLTRDGTALLIRGRLKRKTVALWRLSLRDATLQLALHDEVDDLMNLVRDPYSQRVIGAWTNGLTPEIRWIDEQAEKRATSLSKTFGGKQVELIGRSTEGRRALVGVGTHVAPVTYYLVDFKQGTADIVGEQYPELVDVPMGEVRALKLKARDGHEIPAYLTLPPGSQPVKLPVVVLPHDGPDFRDETKFDPVAQFLATRGYAVLQPQYRGSTGFGEVHRKAGDGQWGGLIQNDVTDSVRALVDQGIAESGRVCIVGTGFGGYIALAGVAFTPELYSCAVSFNGITDLPDFLKQVQRQIPRRHPLLAHLEEQMGDEEDFAGKSPARAASTVKAPVLLLHGVDAAIRPVTQSRKMMTALGGQAPHELIELPGDASWQSDSATRVRVLTEMQRFLAKHLNSGALSSR